MQEAKDPETAVIFLDVVIGYGSHEDPAGEAVKAIKEARAIARASRAGDHFRRFGVWHGG